MNTLGPTLIDRLLEIDENQAKRFRRLTGNASEIAVEGIIRHFAACDRHNIRPDFRAVREIIDDALDGKRIYAEVV